MVFPLDERAAPKRVRGRRPSSPTRTAASRSTGFGPCRPPCSCAEGDGCPPDSSRRGARPRTPSRFGWPRAWRPRRTSPWSQPGASRGACRPPRTAAPSAGLESAPGRVLGSRHWETSIEECASGGDERSPSTTGRSPSIPSSRARLPAPGVGRRSRRRPRGTDRRHDGREGSRGDPPALGALGGRDRARRRDDGARRRSPADRVLVVRARRGSPLPEAVDVGRRPPRRGERRRRPCSRRASPRGPAGDPRDRFRPRTAGEHAHRGFRAPGRGPPCRPAPREGFEIAGRVLMPDGKPAEGSRSGSADQAGDGGA